MELAVHLIVKRLRSKEMGYTHSVQPFVAGKAIDDEYLVKNTSSIKDDYISKYEKVFVNGKMVHGPHLTPHSLSKQEGEAQTTTHSETRDGKN